MNPASVLDQLVTYKVNAGGGFVVSGTATGILASNDYNGNICVAFSTQPIPATATTPAMPAPRDWRLVARIPLAKMLDTKGNMVPVTACSVLGNDDDNTVAPTSASMMPNQDSEARLKPLRALATNLPGNPCLFKGGPIPSESPVPFGQPIPHHTRAFFENTDVSFVLANVDRAPVSELTIPFDVNGGVSTQFVLYPSTVEVSEAARIVLGPIDSLTQTPTSPPLFEAPYLFVVDQRRLGRAQGGGPTRGQLVRINPVGYAATIGSATGVQPTYEDYTRSGNLFPIQ